MKGNRQVSKSDGGGGSGPSGGGAGVALATALLAVLLHRGDDRIDLTAP